MKLAGPSIARRVFVTSLLAFGLVLVVLEAYTYWEFRQAIARDQGLKKLARGLAAALEGLTEDEQARLVMAATDTQFKHLRISGNLAGSTLMQLRDGAGKTLYSSPAASSQALLGTPLQVVTRQIEGKSHWVYGMPAGRWSLWVAEPELTDAWVLEFNARRLLPYLLVAFPFVLVPIWLAVKLGLRPLRQLAERIALREPDDLAPIGVDPRHAELKPLVLALENMLVQLRAKVERERAFVQDAAHELRTPMAVITAQAHALSGAASSEDRDDARVQLEQAIARASHLTQQLLELASLDDAQRAQPREVDAAQLTRQIMAQAAPRAMARGIELALEAPDSLVARIDVPAFQSILENLLGNALNYVHDGAQVALTLQREGAGLGLSVRDNGPGIAPAQHELVFERFWRGVGHESPGSGLGLAIVKQAASRMGGRVAVCAGLDGRGVGFHALLPSAAA